MDPAADTFRSVFDADFDRCFTVALEAAEWQEEAFDAVTVALVEVAVGIGSGEPAPWNTVDQRARELAVEAGATRPASRFLDRHLTSAQGVVRHRLGALTDALEDLDLDPGDAFTTPEWARSLRDDLREAITDAVIGPGPQSRERRRWWAPHR